MTLTLATYNVQYGFGRDGCYDLARAITAVQSADILALQEVERNWQRSGMSDQPAEIEALLPDHFWVYGAPFDVDASMRDSAGRSLSRRRQFGMMLLSRWPILSMRLHSLPKHDAGPAFNMVTGMIEAVIDAPGGALGVYNVHLGHIGTDERLAQIARLREVVQCAAREAGAWSGTEADASHWHSDGLAPPVPEVSILLGDFNAAPGTPEYAALLEPWAGDGEGLAKDGLVDGWLAAGNAEDGGITFRADPKQGTFEDQRIDYCFATAGLARRIRRCWIDMAANGSDHQPVWLEIDS